MEGLFQWNFWYKSLWLAPNPIPSERGARSRCTEQKRRGSYPHGMPWQVYQEQGLPPTLSFSSSYEIAASSTAASSSHYSIFVSLEMSILKRLRFTLKYASLSKHLKKMQSDLIKGFCDRILGTQLPMQASVSVAEGAQQGLYSCC